MCSLCLLYAHVTKLTTHAKLLLEKLELERFSFAGTAQWEGRGSLFDYVYSSPMYPAGTGTCLTALF